MTIREILRMGDPRLLRVAQPVTAFDTDELHWLVRDMIETMRAAFAVSRNRRIDFTAPLSASLRG